MGEVSPRAKRPTPRSAEPDDSSSGKSAPEKSARTRARILGAALALFRERGFDRTTMRAIAARADMSLGAAYYHFTSKEALVLAYYRQLHDDRKAHAAQLFARTDDLRERVLGLYRHHLAAFEGDHRLLSALVRIVADPESEASIFASGTRDIREADIALFRRAVAGARGVATTGEQLELAALSLWTFQLGLLLYFVWDESEQVARTLQLAEQAIDLAMPLLPLLGSPMVAPLFARLHELLAAAGLLQQG